MGEQSIEIESRAKTKERLQEEGRWGSFVRRRYELEGEGKSKPAAHAAALEEFQPADGRRVRARTIAEEETAKPKKGRPVGMRRVVAWVADNLDKKKPKGAPSPLATTLHRLYTVSDEERRKFTELYMRTFAAKQAEDEERAKDDPGAELALGLLEKWEQQNAEIEHGKQVARYINGDVS